MVATPRCARNIQTSARYEAAGRALCKAAVSTDPSGKSSSKMYVFTNVSTQQFCLQTK